MMGFRYETIARIASTVSPYRGTPNRFPLSKRADLRRYFLTATENGETVFDIGYGHRWKRDEISEEEGKAAIARGDSDVHEYNPYHTKQEPVYYRAYKVHNIIGRVRSDNTIEFTAEVLDQGDRYFVSQLFHGNAVFNDSRRGGVIYSRRPPTYQERLMFPVCHDVRYNTETFTPQGSMQVTLRTVKRGEARALVAAHEKYFKVSEAMANAITNGDMWMETAHEIAMEHIPEHRNEYFIPKKDAEKIVAKATSLMDSAPLDAMVLLAIAQNIRSMRSVLLDSRSSKYVRSDDAARVCAKVSRLVGKSLYMQRPDIFVEKVYCNGAAFPQTAWGVRITVDGQVKQQYGYSAT